LVLYILAMFQHVTITPTRLCPGPDGGRHLVDLPHDVLVRLVDLHEHLGLGRELALDVRGGEDALQVQPGSLAVQPLVLKDITQW